MPKPAHPAGRTLYIAITILVLIIAMASIGAAGVRRHEHYLAGLWVGDPVFLKRARLRDFQLFIAPRENGCRQGYLIITDEDGGFISNQAIEINERPRKWAAVRSMFRTKKDACASRHFEVEYDDVEEGNEPPMPVAMIMALSILDGTLTLYDNKKIYAFMAKDHATSAAAIEAYSV
jgi:hypothetical protein